MEATATTPESTVNQVYEYAANLLVHGGRSGSQVEQLLQERGLDAESAGLVVSNLQEQIRAAKKARAKKDVLYGALWCAGGLALTLADIGFIFWGAIVFGGYQLLKGLVNLAGD